MPHTIKHIAWQVFSLGLLATVGFSLCLPAYAQNNTPTPTSSNGIVVKLKQDLDKNRASQDLKKTLALNGTPEASSTTIAKDYIYYHFNDKITAQDALAQLKRSPEVEIAQPNYRYQPFAYTPDDPEFGPKQWYLKDQASGISMQSTWEFVGKQQSTTACSNANLNCGGKATVKIAVIDSGVNVSASDFAQSNIDTANSVRLYDNGSTACPANEYIDQQNGIYLCKKVGSQFDDTISSNPGHGTAVASVISMSDNQVGSIGVAYNTTMLPIALHGEMFSTLGLLLAIDHAILNNVKVINLSLGGPNNDTVIKSIIDQAVNKGIVVVAATGNCAIWKKPDCDWNGNGIQDGVYEQNNAVYYPAAWENVISVGASNYASTANAITRSKYANYGSYLDVVAPVGDGTTVPSGVRALNKSGTITNWEGTSFSAPQVSAAIGLLASVRSGVNFNYVKEAIKNSSTDLGPAGRDSQFGHGLLKVNDLLYIFPDVSRNHVFAPHIYALRDDGIIGGYPDGFFKPGNKVTRGQMAKFVKNAIFGTNYTNTTCEAFPDVTSSNSFYNDIMTLKCENVVGGFDDGQFKPEREVTRGQATKFIIEGARKKTANPTFLQASETCTTSFADVPSTHVFYEYVRSAACNQIVNGFSPTSFQPETTVDRGGMSKMVDKTRQALP